MRGSYSRSVAEWERELLYWVDSYADECAESLEIRVGWLMPSDISGQRELWENGHPTGERISGLFHLTREQAVQEAVKDIRAHITELETKIKELEESNNGDHS